MRGDVLGVGAGRVSEPMSRADALAKVLENHTRAGRLEAVLFLLADGRIDEAHAHDLLTDPRLERAGSELVQLRAALLESDSRADDERRLGVLLFLFDGICLSCGRVVGDRICHCENDE